MLFLLSFFFFLLCRYTALSVLGSKFYVVCCVCVSVCVCVVCVCVVCVCVCRCVCVCVCERTRLLLAAYIKVWITRARLCQSRILSAQRGIAGQHKESTDRRMAQNTQTQGMVQTQSMVQTRGTAQSMKHGTYHIVMRISCIQ